MKKRYSLLIALLLLVLSIVPACRRTSAHEKRYDLRGKVVSVDKDKQLVTIAHEEIKDYMPAMTMPFKVRDQWAFDVLAPGNDIAGALVVDDSQSWLEELVITNKSANAGSAVAVGEAEPGDEVPDYALINQDGRPITIQQYRGKTLLLTFIYTRCPLPDYCALMSNNFAEIDQELQKQPELYAKTHLLSITIDPDYDTPKVLRSYGAAHTGRFSDETFAHWEFATGTKEQVNNIADYFGLQHYEQSDQIIHSLRTAIIAPNGRLHKVYRGNEWKPAEVLEDLRKEYTRAQRAE